MRLLISTELIETVVEDRITFVEIDPDAIRDAAVITPKLDRVAATWRRPTGSGANR